MRCGRFDRAVELPHGHHRLEAGAGTGGRLLRGAQAFGSHPAGRAGTGGDHRRSGAAGWGVQPGLRYRAGGGRALGGRSAYCQDFLHRQQCGGCAGNAAGGGDGQGCEPGTGRQIAVAGAGGRRPGTCGGAGLPGWFLQCRADVFGHQSGAGGRSPVSGLYRAVEDPGRGDPRRRSVCRRQ
ncbi:hypothetical protein D3C76_1086930 [compost metagenome]